MDDKSRNEFHRAYIDNDLKAIKKICSNLPQSVIKFFNGSYSGDNNRYLNLLTNQQLWVTAPQFFNDPFDCVINIDFDSSSYQVLLNKLYRYFDGKESCDKLLNLAKKDEAGYKGFLKFISYDYRKRVQEIGKHIFVSCFSEVSNLKSLRMWGYYANSHRGFCLEYNTYEIYNCTIGFSKNNFIEFLPVRYSDNYIIRYNGEKSTRGAREFISTYAYVKAREWEYEKEWRLAMLSDKNKGQKGFIIPFLTPVRVYLGCKIENKLKSDLLQKCKQMGITAYQAYMEPNSYNLAYKEMTI